MGEYIVAQVAAQDAADEPSSHPLGQSIAQPGSTTAFQFPIIASLLREFADMSEPSSRSGKGSGRRGRKAHAKVPCDDCITRASRETEPTATLELCEKCMTALHRPRGRKQQEQANTRKVRKQSHAVVDTAIGIQTEPIAMPWSNDRQEQHSLNFFVKHSASQLAGYFDSPFWQRMVLQAGHHEPSVRHALAAIGSLHEKLLAGTVDPSEPQDARTRFALEQCNKSIQYLVKPGSAEKTKPNLRLMLTTCVLFTCFEALQGHCEQAIIHATQGYSLLQQYAVDPESKRWDVGAFAVELDQLCLLMRRLQTQSKGLMGKDFNMVPDANTFQCSSLPTKFNSLREARSSLEMVLNHLTVYFLDMELDDQFYDLAISNAEKVLLFSPWLSAWERAFSTYLSEHQSSFSAEDRKAAMVLKAHHLVAEILSDVDLSQGELGWDVFHDKFRAIVELATAYLQGSSTSDASIIEARWKSSGVFISAPSATLSFSLGIVDPLYEVCSRCRDPSLRRRALDLLAKHPRQECVWSSWSAWKVGKFVIRMEEEGSPTPPKEASDVPAEQRLSETWIDFSDKSSEEGKKGLVGYRRAIPRASARYALNPGLFDLENESSGFTQHRGPRSPRTEAYATPPLSSARQASLASDSSEDTPFIDFDAVEQMTALPSAE